MMGGDHLTSSALGMATGASMVSVLTTLPGFTRKGSSIGVFFSGYNQDQPSIHHKS
jgi:hypothetical protein